MNYNCYCLKILPNGINEKDRKANMAVQEIVTVMIQKHFQMVVISYKKLFAKKLSVISLFFMRI